MSEPLKFKVEKALTAFLEDQALSELSGYHLYQGQNPNEKELNSIGIEATGMRESFPDSMPKDVTVTIGVETGVDDDGNADGVAGAAADRTANWTAHRAAVAAIEQALQELDALKAFANSVNVTNRPVSDFYIYDIQEDGQGSTFIADARMLISVITLTIVCEAQDN